ncbi:helix-turn-helix domain-containing protein [Bosea sp. 2KB_26]|uniref:helix-turn-helix domain-containing protein n=1 Tax=Bosea sp. 2KB_26 TaxID=3237475 RepID=UPI003F8F2D22
MSDSAQIRAGRHLLDLSQKDVAKATGLSLPTIKRAESEKDVSVSGDAVARIRASLEQAGVTFIEKGDIATGPGVALKARP